MKRLVLTFLTMSMLLALAPAASAAGPRGGTIADVVAASGGTFDDRGWDFDILLNAVSAAGLGAALDDPAADLTVFAPTDAAFIRTARDLGYTGWSESGAWDFLVAALTGLGGGNPIPVLTNILLYHVAPSSLTPGQVLGSQEISTLLSGAVIRPHPVRMLRDNDPDLRDPRLLPNRLNIWAENGVIHAIDRVLIPINI
jgi:serralysin